MLVIFARHGETSAGTEGSFCGHMDSPLTEKGRDQAKNLGYYCKEKRVKNILTSPFGRAAQTASIVGEILGVSYSPEESLREVCYGDWEGKKREEIDRTLWNVRKKDIFRFIHPGVFNTNVGESYQQVYKRVVSFLGLLHSNNNSVIISHVGIMRSVLLHYGKKPLSSFGLFTPKNNEIIEVEFLGDHWTKPILKLL